MNILFIKRLYSTRSSVQQSEVTFLAILETALALIISFIAVYKTNSLILILTSAILAPFFLLRTDISDDVGIALFKKLYWLRTPKFVFVLSMIIGLIITIVMTIWTLVWGISGLLNFLGVAEQLGHDNIFAHAKSVLKISCYIYIPIVIIVFGLGIFLSYLVRASAVIYALAFRPINTLSAVPDNWFRYIWCYDFFTIPEVFPGLSNDSELEEDFSFHSLSELIPASIAISLIAIPFTGGLSAIILIVSSIANFISVLLFVYIPAFVFRFSIKSIVLIYLPLLYLAKISFLRQSRPTLFKTVSDDKIRVKFAWFTLFCHLALPLIVIFIVGNLSFYTEPETILEEILILFSFYPIVYVLFTASKILNAMIVIFTSKIATVAYNKSWGANVELFVRIAFLLSALLTVYSIVFMVFALSKYYNPEQLKHGVRYVLKVLSELELDWSILPSK